MDIEFAMTFIVVGLLAGVFVHLAVLLSGFDVF